MNRRKTSLITSIPPALTFLALMFLTPSAVPGSDAGFYLPAYEKLVCDNGMTIYLMEQHEVPLIYVSAVFPAGAVRDGDRNGLASLTAEALLFGTKNYTKDEIEEQLDFMGASYGTSASKEYAEVTMSFLNEDQDIVFRILGEIVTSPTFDEAEFEKRKTRLLIELEQDKERPARVIRSYFEKFLFGDHVYGNPVGGTRSAVEAITPDDVKRFYQENYLPSGSAVAVVGDFATDSMRMKILDLFGSWTPQGTYREVEPGPASPPTENRVLLVDKEDATETRFLIGGPGIERGNPDYIPVQVVNTVLGGRFTSWLNDELRVNAGLTYGAFSRFVTYRESGTFTVISFTATETTTEAIDLALQVLDRLHTKGIDAKTLESAKNYIKGQFPLRYETSGDLAELLTQMYIYGFDESFIDTFEDNVERMTTERARAIITEYFPWEYLTFTLIGKASEIRDRVSRYGTLTEKEITADGF